METRGALYMIEKNSQNKSYTHLQSSNPDLLGQQESVKEMQ